MKDISNNYITIQGYMVTELNLKGNELLVYALINGFSQDEESTFNGSRSYIASWLNCTTKTVDNVVSALIDKGLVEKVKDSFNGVSFNRYKITQVGKNFPQGSEKISLGGREKFSPNNNILNTNKDITKHIYSETENVLLSDKEYSKLKEKYGNDADSIIENFGLKKKAKGYKYKSDYSAILDWGANSYYEKAKKNKKPEVKENGSSEYDFLKGYDIT